MLIGQWRRYFFLIFWCVEGKIIRSRLVLRLYLNSNSLRYREGPRSCRLKFFVTIASRFRFLNFTRPMRLAILTFPHFPVCCGFSWNLSDYFRLQMFSSRGFWLSPFSTACPSRSLRSHFVVSLPDYRASVFLCLFTEFRCSLESLCKNVDKHRCKNIVLLDWSIRFYDSRSLRMSMM